MKHSLFLPLFLCAIFLAPEARAQENPIETDTTDHCKKGLQLLGAYQYDRALEQLQLCYRADPQNIACLEKIGYCNYQLGRFKEAKESYQTIIEQDTAHTAALNQLGSIYAQEGRNREALQQYLRLIALDSTNSFYSKKAAALLAEQDEWEQAAVYYRQSLRLNPEDITIFGSLGKLYEQLDQLERADSLLTKGLALDSANLRLLSSIAKVAYARKDYKGVVERIDQLWQLQPDSTVSMLQMAGIAHFHLKNYEPSIRLLDQVVQMGRGTEFVHYYLGLAFRSTAELEKSAHHFNEAVRNGISENIAIYYTNLGVAYEEQQNYGESIKAYQAAYKSSRDPKLLYHLARNYDTYYSEKNTALLYYEKFLTQNDSGHVQLKDYSEHRIHELKEIIHFNIDTLQ